MHRVVGGGKGVDGAVARAERIVVSRAAEFVIGRSRGSGVNETWGGGATNPDAGCYRWVRQTVTVGGSLDEVGTISVTMADHGGSDGATVILALDIRPAELVPPITLTRTSPENSELPLTELPADGLTRDTYQGAGAPANATVTVTVSAGSPPHYATVLPDVDSTMFGAQVPADAFGQFTFTVQRPATLTNTTLDPPQTSEAWTITAEEVSGLARATVTQTHVALDAAAPLRFDFGVSGSPVQKSPDFLPVIPQTVYSQTRGYGWLSRVAGVNREDPTMSALQTDLNYAQTAMFKVDLPDGMYSVRIYHSNPKCDNTVPYVADNFQVFAEDAAQYTVENIPAGTAAIRTFTVAVSDGALELRFLDLGGLDGNFVVSGIEISAGLVLPGEAPLLAKRNPLAVGATAQEELVIEETTPRSQGILKDTSSDNQVSYVGSCWHNPIDPYDVSGDQRVTPLDALIVMNYVNSRLGDLQLPPLPSSPPAYYDVDDDGFCTPRDALMVINYTNRSRTGTAEGESSPSNLREPVAPPMGQVEGALGSPPTPSGGALARWPWGMSENHASGRSIATQGKNGTPRVTREIPGPRWKSADGLAADLPPQSFDPTSECEAILEDFADDVAGRWRMESSTPQV